MRTWILAAIFLIGLAAGGSGQDASAKSFEVASVRRVAAGGLTSISPPGAVRFTARNVSLSLLVCMAYGVDTRQVSGPGWLDSEYYDVEAKPEGDAGLSYEALRPMLQGLLVQRFRLVVHREVKETPGYALVVAKGGPKLTPTKGAGGTPSFWNDGLQAMGISLKTVAGMLASILKQPVMDATSIPGEYDVSLKFAREGELGSELPSVFTAVREQLGLKLEPRKVPAEVLVVDRAEKVPVEN